MLIVKAIKPKVNSIDLYLPSTGAVTVQWLHLELKFS